jgi:hypothetical protein
MVKAHSCWILWVGDGLAVASERLGWRAPREDSTMLHVFDEAGVKPNAPSPPGRLRETPHKRISGAGVGCQAGWPALAR